MSTIMQPAAFFSYSHHDDNHDHGYLTKLRDRLSGEVRSHHAKEFPIFQDRNSIEWGQNWIERITESLRGVTFLIPIITPNYFASEACLDELRQFAEYGKNVNRNDLILPIYYIRCEQMETNTTPDDELVNLIKDHQYKDWRDLRGKSLKLVKFNERLEELALDITNMLNKALRSARMIHV